MTRSIIYTVDADNRLTAMSPAAPENEDTMQRLIADYPEIIADADGALLLIRREQPIADAEGSRWSLDHLFVTRTGVPVLVEMKRASDTRLRREVVGQMLDYAANATAHWQAGTIAASFAATAETQGRDADQVLAEFLDDTAEPDAFWPQVDANFAAGRIKLVFVADVIRSAADSILLLCRREWLRRGIRFAGTRRAASLSLSVTRLPTRSRASTAA